MRCSGLISEVHNLKKFFGRWSSFLNDALDLNIIAFVFHNVQIIFVVEKVKTASCINLEKADIYIWIPL